jgi:hypothetical protein
VGIDALAVDANILVAAMMGGRTRDIGFPDIFGKRFRKFVFRSFDDEASQLPAIIIH